MKKIMFLMLISALMFISQTEASPPVNKSPQIAQADGINYQQQSTIQPAETQVATVAKSDSSPINDPVTPVVQPVNKEGDVPKWWDYVLTFLESVAGVSILRLLTRYIPSSWNIDFVGFVVKLINLIYGAWIPNRDKDGGVHVRDYSQL